MTAWLVLDAADMLPDDTLPDDTLPDDTLPTDPVDSPAFAD